MCGLPRTFAQFEAKRAAEAQMREYRARQVRIEQMRETSSTPYQDELQSQLDRVRNEWFRGQYVMRRFYCAGITWEASVWVDESPT